MSKATPTYEDLARRLVAHAMAGTRPGDDPVSQLVRMAGTVMALSRDFGAYLLPPERLQHLSQALCQAVGAQSCRIHLTGDDGQTISLRSDGGQDDPTPLSGLAATALNSGEPMMDGAELCVPLPGREGVFHLVGKAEGFSKADAELMLWASRWIEVHARRVVDLGPENGDRSSQVSPAALESDDEMALDVVLNNLLQVAVEIVGADRGSIFLYEPGTEELVTRAVTGLGARRIRLPATLGIVGTVFLTGEAVVCNDAYGDLRFNPAVDRLTGYRTRNILCVPIVNGDGRRVGVTQLLNRRDGGFTRSDENRVKVLSQQAGIALDSWRMFHRMAEATAYKETILRSLSDGVLTVDNAGAITFVNPAALGILRRDVSEMIGQPLASLFEGTLNGWLLDVVREVAECGEEKVLPAAEIEVGDSDWASVNITTAPLTTQGGVLLGQMIVLEDVTREQNFRRAMSRYVSDAVVDTVMRGEGPALEGAQQEVSVLFSDIRSFTTLTETLGAPGTVALLNEYFSFMEDVVTNRDGLIDKYIGDALMALFGAPVSRGNDADNAVTAAVDMFQVLRLFNQRRETPIRIGIGIATGPVITGNIGSSKRQDFTAIGNPVNLSSRLESLTKYYGCDIMVCGTTFKALTKPFMHRCLDVIRVRGQTTSTPIHEIVHCRADELAPRTDELFAQYGEALDAYIAGDWESGLKGFQTCLRLNDKDQASKLMTMRCRQLIANPPETWANVWTYN